MAGSAIQPGGYKPEADQYPERNSRLHLVVSDRQFITTASG